MATNSVKKNGKPHFRRLAGIQKWNGIAYRYHNVRINSVNDASKSYIV